jgi:hypothetical protein
VNCCPILELRQYTLHPGKRDDLIELFDREFVESQEALGATIVGQFRDLEDPDRFVWLRGFSDMDARLAALGGFYGGPVWKAHREAANATMVDSDNVLLLRPARAGSGFALDGLERPSGETKVRTLEGLVVWISSFDGPVAGRFIDFFEREMKPAVESSGDSVLAYFMTEPSPNNFPALPVREGENVFVWFCRASDGVVESRESIARGLPTKTQVLRLTPTTRSLLR